MGETIRLIAGLGNPGSKYDKTRHNAGFWFVDELARRFGGTLLAEKRFSGEACKVMIANQPVWLLKPQTFMNKSGLSLRQLTDFFKIPVEQVLVVHDEMDIDAGDVRLKKAGGHGGHNGLRDIHAHLSKDYWRIRVGVGHPGDRSKVVDYVVSQPSKDEDIAIQRAIDRAADHVEQLVAGDMQKAMNDLHRKA